MVRLTRKRTLQKVLVILVPIVMISFSEICVFGQEWTAVQKEIWELEEARWKALLQVTIEGGYLKHYREDGSFWPYWSEEPLSLVKYKEGVIQRAGGAFNVELTPLSVKVVGEIAIVQYHCKLATYAGTIYTKVTSIRVKKDDVWQVISDMHSKRN